MNEGLWQTAPLHRLLRLVQGRLSPRQMRLFACACVRRLPTARRSSNVQAIELAERFADGRASGYDLAQARFSGRFQPGHTAWAVCWAPGEDDWGMMERALAWTTGFAAHSAHQYSFRREEEAQAELLREIVGDPAHSHPIDPLWRLWDGGVVVRLARGIYDERSFEQMPILADALEEAGCTDEVILLHCRTAREHVRGCWVVDLLLGKR